MEEKIEILKINSSIVEELHRVIDIIKLITLEQENLKSSFRTYQIIINDLDSRIRALEQCQK